MYEPGNRPWFMTPEQAKIWDTNESGKPPPSRDDIFVVLVPALVNIVFIAFFVAIPWAAYNALFYTVYGVKVYAIAPAAFALVGAAFIYDSFGTKRPARWLSWLMLAVSIAWGTYKIMWGGGSSIDMLISIGGAITGIATSIRKLKQSYGRS